MTTEDFIREFKTDPHAAMIVNMCLDFWAMGYEAAARDVESEIADERGVIEPDNSHYALCALLRKNSVSQLRNRAGRELADNRQRSEQEMILAMATLSREHRRSPA